MKLLTHNMLQSNMPGVTQPYPLRLEVSQVEQEENEFNKEFVVHMFPRLNYEVLVQALQQTGYSFLPDSLPENHLENDNFLKLVHQALLNVNVVEGKLICPETGRQYPITKGIPNMLLSEEETG
ncbi:Multifunctional methyltransferase subunit TRM112-like protein [Balamuthia mandrillaris]